MSIGNHVVPNLTRRAVAVNAELGEPTLAAK